MIYLDDVLDILLTFLVPVVGGAAAPVLNTVGGVTSGSNPLGAVGGAVGGVTNTVGGVAGSVPVVGGAAAPVLNTVGGVTSGSSPLGAVGSTVGGVASTVGGVAGSVPVVGGAVQGVTNTVGSTLNSALPGPYPLGGGVSSSQATYPVHHTNLHFSSPVPTPSVDSPSPSSRLSSAS